MEENKCEKAGLQHAWRDSSKMWGFYMASASTCANCGLNRTKCSETKEWYSYSDGRPNEPIINVRPV